jgi:hypothetical protein
VWLLYSNILCRCAAILPLVMGWFFVFHRILGGDAAYAQVPNVAVTQSEFTRLLFMAQHSEVMGLLNKVGLVSAVVVGLASDVVILFSAMAFWQIRQAKLRYRKDKDQQALARLVKIALDPGEWAQIRERAIKHLRDCDLSESQIEKLEALSTDRPVFMRELERTVYELRASARQRERALTRGQQRMGQWEELGSTGEDDVDEGDQWVESLDAVPVGDRSQQEKPPSLPARFRESLLAVLERMAITETYQGRSLLLNGLPDRGLSRNENNRRVDLELIVDVLQGMGRLSSGEWPLLKVISNAVTYVEGYQAEEDLQALRVEMATIYEEHHR